MNRERFGVILGLMNAIKANPRRSKITMLAQRTRLNQQVAMVSLELLVKRGLVKYANNYGECAILTDYGLDWLRRANQVYAELGLEAQT